jgi:hypothetical protein
VANDGAGKHHLEILDGVRNLLPAGVGKGLQDCNSCLVDAYKYAEADPETTFALYGLTANVVDRPEASEALRVTVAWQAGMKGASLYLDGSVGNRFISGHGPTPRPELKGQRGSYLLRAEIVLAGRQTRSWHIVLDTPVDHAGVVELQHKLNGDVSSDIETDIRRGGEHLSELLASADAFQVTVDPSATTHHTANVLFNIARGGVLPNQYNVDRSDLADFLAKRNGPAASKHAPWLAGLPASLPLTDLLSRAETVADPNLVRLCYEYLPIVFSRRHGDPSRPWNQFSIVMKRPDGSPLHAYEGNWRDIFQNWEALCRSFPECLESVIAKFVNASTVDGFNPYRITQEGIDWEMPDPDDPWTSIGYWGDHQIIYLLKLLEASKAHHPRHLTKLLNQDWFCYADVPYDIRPYADIVRNARDTITFNGKRQKAIDKRVGAIGSDGNLVDRKGEILHVNLAEKLLVSILAKLSSLVPEGGIWMNTVRPEWNDANNALSGNGMSVVTTCYLYRHLGFCISLFQDTPVTCLDISSKVADWMAAVAAIIGRYSDTALDDCRRRGFMDAVGNAFSNYRASAYSEGLGERKSVRTLEIIDLLRRAHKVVGWTIEANRRPDGLYHAYNILHLGNDSATVSRLPLMLEGQVAALSSGLLSAEEVLALLNALRASELYRVDQASYLLYPVKQLPPFLRKNRVPDSILKECSVLAARIASGDDSVLVRDAGGQLRFHPDFHNADALRTEIEDTLPEGEVVVLLDTYEKVFNHKAFTGRSGTMYLYEGIGCIYWHMVAKLLLAAQESFDQAVAAGENRAIIDELKNRYLEIRAGLGFTKSPDEFGAFPLDPYSHTPAFGGAKQPGMTGQVKEEILTRLGELGVHVNEGRISFTPQLLGQDEFLTEPTVFDYVDSRGIRQSLRLRAGSLAFTLCQVPVVYTLGNLHRIAVKFVDGSETHVDGDTLTSDISGELFRRTGRIRHLTVHLPRL